jgi:hypothetical protein
MHNPNISKPPKKEPYTPAKSSKLFKDTGLSATKLAIKPLTTQSKYGDSKDEPGQVYSQ